MQSTARVIEFGDVPPPYGGVSVHLRRLLARLVEDGWDVTHVSRQNATVTGVGRRVAWPTLPRWINHLEFVRASAPPFGSGVLHLHDNPIFCAPLILAHILRGGCALVTVHSELVELQMRRALPHERIAFRAIAGSPKVKWIAVSDGARASLLELSVAEDAVDVIPAYLREPARAEQRRLPDDLSAFLDAHRPALVVYGARRAFIDGRDLYGFDYALAVLQRILRVEPAAGLVLLCAGTGKRDAGWERLRAEVEEAGLSSHVVLIGEALEDPGALWERCTAMLRPTITDGDSVAIREMLALGGRVIASDVVKRPPGTIVLPLQAPERWARCAIEHAAVPGGLETPDGYEQIISSLRSLAEMG